MQFFSLGEKLSNYYIKDDLKIIPLTDIKLKLKKKKTTMFTKFYLKCPYKPLHYTCS